MPLSVQKCFLHYSKRLLCAGKYTLLEASSRHVRRLHKRSNFGMDLLATTACIMYEFDLARESVVGFHMNIGIDCL